MGKTTMHSKPYGTWHSAVTPQMMADSLRLDDVGWDDDGETLVWLERRAGRGVLVCQQGADAPRDLNTDLSVRGGVGYGGGAFTAGAGAVYFAADGRLFRQSLSGGSARPLTPAFGRAAGPALSPDGQWLAFVHSYEDVDCVAVVDRDGAIWPRKLACGADFVMQPVWHPSGRYLACVAWNNPQMPWNGTELRLITLSNGPDGVPYAEMEDCLAGDTTTAIFQPAFSPDGRYLSYISDASGFGQLMLYDLQQGTHTQLTQHSAEHGTPAWIQGLRVHGWTADSAAIYYTRSEQGVMQLCCYDLAHKNTLPVTELNQHYTRFDQIATSPRGESLAMIASSPSISPRVISFSPESGLRVHRRSTTESITPDAYAVPQPLTWPGHDGEVVHGLYYAPTNPAYIGQGQPPLMVMVHSGPTSFADAGYDLKSQFFATRGFAVLQVNYRGSTGYGRAYMDKHAGNWGVYDVEDAASGAQHLVDAGRVDSERLVIMGSSAGGYTVLQSLASKPGFYRAGICAYGIANHFALALDTHKFERYYNDWLLGPLPDAAHIWRERSPLFHADKIQDALLLFQGSDDPVVPQAQADAMAQALSRRGVRCDYHVYAGEGHGWRQPETIADYYGRIMRFLLTEVIYA